MARCDLLFQAITKDFHAEKLRELLAVSDLKRFVASVAFVQENGVDAIADGLRAVAKQTRFLVGIRNEITSIQAVLRLIQIGVEVFAVDTGSRSPIFHPKLFIVETGHEASLIIGSANMTFSGLHNNIEASVILSLNPKQRDDKTFLQAVFAALDDLPISFPDHVFRIADDVAAEKLFEDGRLIDEGIVVAPAVRSLVRRGERDKLGPMQLARHARPVRRARRLTRPSSRVRRRGVVAATVPKDFVLVWESRGLSERDLNIPSGANTNPTGSMLWKKGATEDIDQRHFFREDVFSGLRWRSDKSRPHIERALARFQIVVKGLDYGTYLLKLSHNTDATSASYRQKNSMTQVHWGVALNILAKRDLLGRTMSLYRKNTRPPQFLIDVD